jgi:hypothetical protein
VNTGLSTAAPKDGELWTVRGLLARHKLAAVGVVAVIALILAMMLVAVFGSKVGAVSDATTCSQWASANQTQQAAYARLYVREHGTVSGRGSSAANVIAAINRGCIRAYGEDVSDTATVVQAVSGDF